MDTPSLLARNVLDVIAMYDCLSGFDDRDPQSNRRQNDQKGKLFHKLFNIDIPQQNKWNILEYSTNDIQSILQRSKDEINLKGVTIGIPMEYNIADMSDVIRDTWLDAIR